MPFLHRVSEVNTYLVDYGPLAGKWRCVNCDLPHESPEDVRGCIARRTREVHPRVAEWQGDTGSDKGYLSGGTFRVVADDARIVCSDGYATVRVMSDVWDTQPHVILRTSEGFVRVHYSEECTQAEIDEPEAEAEARAWFAARAAEREANERAFHEARRKAEIDRVEAYPVQGSICRVVKGRKVPIGTVGECFWIGEHAAYGPRVGLRDDRGTVHWTAASNVERVRDRECFWKHQDCADNEELRKCCSRDGMRAIVAASQK